MRPATKTWEDTSESDLEEPFAVHVASILAKTKKEEDSESNRDLNPNVKNDCSVGRYRGDISPIGMDLIPAVLHKRMAHIDD